MFSTPVKSGAGFDGLTMSLAWPGKLTVAVSVPPRKLSKANTPRASSAASPAVSTTLRPALLFSRLAAMGAALAPSTTLPLKLTADGRMPMPAKSRLNGVMETPLRIAIRSSLALMWNLPCGVSSGGGPAAPPPGCSLEPVRPILEPSSEWPRSR